MSQIEKLYKQVNKYYPVINQRMIDEIVDKFELIGDIFEKYYIEGNKNKSHWHKTYIPYKIKSNETLHTASTFSTVLSFVCAMFHFHYEFTEREKFKLATAFDFLLCHVHNFSTKVMDEKFLGKPKYKCFCFNNENINDMYQWFVHIDIEDIDAWMKPKDEE